MEKRKGFHWQKGKGSGFDLVIQKPKGTEMAKPMGFRKPKDLEKESLTDFLRQRVKAKDLTRGK